MARKLHTAFLLLGAIFCTGQEAYTIKMQVRMEGLPPEYAAYGDQEITTYIKGDKSKTEVNSVMYSSVVYFDGKKLTTLNDVMGDRQGYTATKEELEGSDTGKKGGKPHIEYTKEKKLIAGYECTKAIITSKGQGDDTTKIISWVTDKINADRTPRRAARGLSDLGDLKGQPLEMEVSQKSNGNNVKLIMTTSEVLTTPLEDSVFEANTEGYKMLSFREWQEQMKTAKGR